MVRSTLVGTPSVEHVGRYELLIELAKGGMAELYLGRLHGAGGFEKLVAIKRILPHLAEDKQFVEMFLNEGRIAARLSHANICDVYELGEDEGELFLVMEYLDGVSWDALIKLMPRTPETLRLAAGVIAQACDGLHFAHELRDVDGSPTPVIHRDVSPQNLFVTIEGTCKVLDFGVSKMMKDGPRTRTGVLKGKLPYMSPEQIQGEPLDARSDVFALGVCVWEALTGNSLFDRDTDFLIWKAITEAPIPPLVPHGFPPGIDAVIGSALDRDRNRRFRSAKALGEALRNAAEAVGGAYTPAEIAEVVKARCGEKLAERAREVATVVSGRRVKPTLEPTAADTIEDKAGSTVSLRPDSVKVARPAPPPPPRARWPLVVGALGVIGGVAAIVAVTRGGGNDQATPVTQHAPAPAPAPAPALRPGQVAGIQNVALTGEPGVLTTCTTSHRCMLTCPLGKCEFACERGATCDLSCPLGGCKLACAAGAVCSGDCAGGNCVSACATSATCTFGCAGGGCTYDCGPASACITSCVGGGCTGGGRTSGASTATRPVTPVSKQKKPTAAAPVTNGDPGTLSIDSTPYATIYVDGAYLGDTPLFGVRVPSGKHQFKAVLQDNRTKTFTVEIRAGQLTNWGKLAW